jgi:pimeloyl-ACP methyl ester carboxylesterase
MSPTSTAKLVSSKDGALIYADAAGDPTKPCLVFLHGLALSAAVFDNIFANLKLTENFYLVRPSRVLWNRIGLPIPLG